MTRLHVVGNSHVWTLFGWDRVAGWSDSQPITGSDGDLEMSGLTITGATAHNLEEAESSTHAWDKIQGFLDSDPGPDKTLLVVFGEVDCSTHFGHHGSGDGTAIVNTLHRYEQALRHLDERPDIRHLLVASTVPHHPKFKPDRRAEIAAVSVVWNSEVRDMCRRLGWTYVDLYTPFLGDDGVYAARGMSDGADQNHLHPDDRDGMVEAILKVIKTAVESPDAFPTPPEFSEPAGPESDQ